MSLDLDCSRLPPVQATLLDKRAAFSTHDQLCRIFVTEFGR